MEKLTCKECPLYRKPSIHGHGEYFGECGAIFEIGKIIENRLQFKNTITMNPDRICINAEDPYQYVRDEKDTCKLFTKTILKDYYKKDERTI